MRSAVSATPSSSATSWCDPTRRGRRGAPARRRPHRARRAAICLDGLSSARIRPSCSRSTRCRARTRWICRKHVKDKMDELSKRFPKGIDYAMHYDTTRFVSASNARRAHHAGRGADPRRRWSSLSCSCRAGAPPSFPTIAIPVSLIATLAVMEVLGFSLNMLSLLGMVLAIGLVVDDAIVVVENVERQLEAGLPPLEATRRAMRRGHRADHRHDRGADGGFRARRLHPRRGRPALQPVRPDGRDLGRSSRPSTR